MLWITTHRSSRNLSSAFYYIRLPTLLTVNVHVTCEMLNSSHACVKCNQKYMKKHDFEDLQTCTRDNDWEVLKVWNHSSVYLIFVTLSHILFFCVVMNHALHHPSQGEHAHENHSTWWRNRRSYVTPGSCHTPGASNAHMFKFGWIGSSPPVCYCFSYFCHLT